MSLRSADNFEKHAFTHEKRGNAKKKLSNFSAVID